MSNKNKSKSSKNKGSSDKKGKKKESKKSSAMSMVKSIVLALLLALLVRVFIFEMFKIPSCSMEPTLEGVDMSHGDRVGVSKLSYMFGKVNRYDVLVFSAETVINGKKYNRDYIKRVAGFENEKLELRAGDLYVNDDIAPKPHDVQQSVATDELILRGFRGLLGGKRRTLLVRRRSADERGGRCHAH
ncbi:MAG: signal peptidase I [Planctomycetota bacterium]|nr:signal peptidase I [Planctomycetota bacterium]